QKCTLSDVYSLGRTSSEARSSWRDYLSCCLLIIRLRQTASQLFLYTTLFRSRTKRSKLFIKEITPLLFVSFAFFFRLFWKVYNMWFITPLFWDGLWCVVAHYF